MRLILTISKVLTLLCLLCLCGNRDYPGCFQKKLGGSNECPCSVLSQTERRMKPFLEWTSINLFSKLFLKCEINVNYYKSVHHPIPTLGNREHPDNSQTNH